MILSHLSSILDFGKFIFDKMDDHNLPESNVLDYIYPGVWANCLSLQMENQNNFRNIFLFFFGKSALAVEKKLTARNSLTSSSSSPAKNFETAKVTASRFKYPSRNQRCHVKCINLSMSKPRAGAMAFERNNSNIRNKRNNNNIHM
uniref:Uncharacterized protein n=1 Tax=Glossina pallidipes TaxID=7398 RepID=A0A1A9Z6L7_GLOPL